MAIQSKSAVKTPNPSTNVGTEDRILSDYAKIQNESEEFHQALMKISQQCKPDWSIDDSERVDNIKRIASRALRGAMKARKPRRTDA